MSARKLLFLLLLLGSRAGGQEILITAPKELEELPAGAAASVVNLDKTGAGTFSLGEALEHLPGLYVTNSYGLGEREAISVRGFSGAQVKILVDGLALDESRGAADLGAIPVAMIERIIVSRGPLSSIYGSSAMGGVINIVTKKDIQASRALLSYGSYATSLAQAETSLPYMGGRLSLIGYYGGSNGRYRIQPSPEPLRDSAASPRPSTVQNNASNNFGLKVNFAKNRLFGSITYDQKRRGIPGHEGHYTQDVSEAKRQWSAATGADEWQLFPRITMGVRLSAAAQKTEYQDPNGELTGFPTSYEANSKRYGAKIQTTYLASAFAIPTGQLVVGQESFSDGHDQALRNTSLLSASLDTFFFEDRLVFTPSISLAYATNLPSQRSWGLSLEQQLGAPFSLTANYATGFRFPTFEELYLARGFLTGNANLQPEKSRGGDLGLKLKTRHVTGTLSFFRYETANLIEYLLVSGFQYKPFNFSKTQTTGFESTIHFKSEPLDYKASGTVQSIINSDSRSPYDQKTIPGKPWFYGKHSLSYKFYGTWQVAVEQLASKGRFVNRANTKKLPDSLASHFGVQKKVGSGFEIGFQIKNIRDRPNVDVRGFPLAGRGYYLSLEKKSF